MQIKHFYFIIVIQYGFMTLFIVGFPLGPLFSYLNNMFEIRIDAFKTLTQLRRPVAKKTKDIGDLHNKTGLFWP